VSRAGDVYLVPGFFGFANLGQIAYFGHVRRALGERLGDGGLTARIHVVRTQPTASLPRRAARVAEAIAATARGRSTAVHVVGHSCGGLDARLLAAPGITLPTSVDVERIAGRLRTMVTIATPHHGTPVASFFATKGGQRLLQLLSLATIHSLHFGRIPVAVLLRLGSLATRFDRFAINSELFDEIFRQLLDDFTVGRRRAVRSLLRQVGTDQALLLQLTPESMDLFSSAVGDRSSVRYGCVVTRGAPPSFRSRVAAGLDTADQLTRATYGALYRLAAATPRRFRPRLTSETARALRRAYGAVPSVSANDGIVPTRSQLRGKLLHAAAADHLDVLGHFDDGSQRPPHVDWLSRGSGFDRDQFDRLWDSVAHFICES
jgi:hypothetical protein